jgi:hypothetical protein
VELPVGARLLALLCARSAQGLLLVIASAGGAAAQSGSGTASPYDLGKLPECMSGLRWPTAPTIRSQQTVNTRTLARHIGAAGSQLTLQPGVYGDLTLDVDDQEIILQDGAILGIVTVTADVQRLIIRSQNARQGKVANFFFSGRSGGTSDVLIDGVSGNSPLGQSNEFNGNRIAVINSYLRAANYGAGSFPEKTYDGPRDLIFANSNIISYDSQSGIRFMNTDRLVFVDSRVGKESAGLLFRLHADATSNDITCAYIARNQIEGLTEQNFGNVIARNSNPNNLPAAMRGVVFENNDVYCRCAMVFGDGATTASARATGAQTMTLRNNRHFGAPDFVWTFPNAPSPPLPGWVIEGNTALPFQTPPAWSFR